MWGVSLLLDGLLASSLLASVKVADGKYNSDGGLDSNDGTVVSTNGGDDLASVSSGGSGAVWEWNDAQDRYDEDPPGDDYVEFEEVLDKNGDPIDGKYTWKALSTADGAELDSGTLTEAA